MLNLSLLIRVPVVSAVSKPCRLAGIGRGLATARSCAIAGKGNVPRSAFRDHRWNGRADSDLTT